MGVELTLNMTCIDIKRGNDMLDVTQRNAVIDSIKRGKYDCILVCPPCNTWTRARFSGLPGPKPLRGILHPRGFPNLTEARQKECDDGTQLVLFTLDVLKAAASLNNTGAIHCRVIAEHPEDWGFATRGTPASVGRNN